MGKTGCAKCEKLAALNVKNCLRNVETRPYAKCEKLSALNVKQLAALNVKTVCAKCENYAECEQLSALNAKTT